PFGPLNFTVWPVIVAVTFAGTGTGFLPMRDMTFPQLPPLEYVAEDLAADVLLTRPPVGHDALRRGEDRDAEAVGHGLELLDRRVDAAAGLRHAGDLANRRLAIRILQLDLELRLAAAFDARVAADIPFLRQHVEDARAQVGSRRDDFRLPPHLRIADAGQHV